MATSRLPAAWLTFRVLGILGAVIGGTVGVLIGPAHWGLVLGCVAGTAIGLLAGYASHQRARRRTVSAIDRVSHIFFVFLGSAMTLAGIVGFIKTDRWVGLIGAVFFAFGTLYLLRSSNRD